MKENITVVPLRDFKLPKDYARRVGLEHALVSWLSKTLPGHRLQQPRFVGYYFNGAVPTAKVGSFVVTLPAKHPINLLGQLVDEHPNTNGLFSIRGDPDSKSKAPMYMLIHDLWDGSCSLFSYSVAVEFLEGFEACVAGGGPNDGLTDDSPEC